MSPRPDNIARREAVLSLRAKGLTDEEIAEQLSDLWKLNPKMLLGGSVEQPKTATIRRRVRRWRSQKVPVPWTTIAERTKLSRKRLIKIARGKDADKVVNPKGGRKPYHCTECDGTFTSATRTLPSTCGACGSWGWKGDE